MNTADEVFLTSDRVPILYRDQPASDGVLHGISSVLMPNNVDFGQCQPFASITPTPVMSPTLSMAVSPTPLPPISTDLVDFLSETPVLPSLTPTPTTSTNSSNNGTEGGSHR